MIRLGAKRHFHASRKVHSAAVEALESRRLLSGTWAVSVAVGNFGSEYGPSPVMFTFSRTLEPGCGCECGCGSSEPSAMTISFSLGGSATSGDDYSGSTSTVTIPADENSVDLILPVEDDEVVEDTETVDITLTDVQTDDDWMFASTTAEAEIQDNDYNIVRAEIGFDSKTIIKDDGTGIFSSPQWLDVNGNGSVNDAGDTAYPIAYPRSRPGQDFKVTAQVHFSTDRPVSGTFTITGTGTGLSSGLTFTGQTNLWVPGNDISATIVSSQNLSSTIDYGDLTIQWKIERGGKTKTYGSSKDRAYITGANVSGFPETVFAVGCRSAKGKRPVQNLDVMPAAATYNQDVLDAIWGEFQGRAIKDANGTPLVYWGPISSTNYPTPARQMENFTTAGLLKWKDGRCGAWTYFLVDVLAAQGISAEIVTIDANPAAQPTLAGWTSAGVADAPLIIPVSLGGQNNPAPQSIFTNHAVVKIRSSMKPLESANNAGDAVSPNIICDPSYGGSYYTGATWSDSERAWENASIESIRWVYTSPGLPNKIAPIANNPSIAEVIFSS